MNDLIDFNQAQVFARSWGLVLLIILFALGVVYALWPANKGIFQHMAALPLQDDGFDHNKLSEQSTNQDKGGVR